MNGDYELFLDICKLVYFRQTLPYRGKGKFDWISKNFEIYQLRKKKLTLAELGKTYRVTKERIRQIERKVETIINSCSQTPGQARYPLMVEHVTKQLREALE